MSLGSLNVAVVGCGTAGAAAALFLARAGHAVTVYEAVDDPRPVGAGIMIQPTGMHVLDALGLYERVVARGHRVDLLSCRTARRRPVIHLAYADLHPDAFGLGLHRGVLFEALYDAVREEPGVTLRCGVPVEGLERAGPRQKRLVDRAGGRHGPHDLVVVADGARSQLRDDAVLTTAESEYPWGALWFIGDDTERRFDGVLGQVVEGTHHLLGLLPCGLGPEGDVPQVSLFWSIRRDRVDAWREAGLEPWKETIRRLDPRSAPLLEQIEHRDQVLYARYYDVELSPWHTRDAVFLGDAAHATSPQLGQGANLALMDAMALAEALAEARTLQEGLLAYSDGRRAHLGYYQWATRLLTPFFQSDHAPLGLLRDVFMGYACRLPYVRTRMIQTMCGLERGVLGTPPLALPRLPAARLPAVASSDA